METTTEKQVSVRLTDLINHDLDWLNDYVSREITGDPSRLEGISLRVAGFGADFETIVLGVEALSDDPAFCHTCKTVIERPDDHDEGCTGATAKEVAEHGQCPEGQIAPVIINTLLAEMVEQGDLEVQVLPAFTSGEFTADGEMVFAALGERTYGKRVADCSPNEYEDDTTQQFVEGEAEANALLFAAAPSMYKALLYPLEVAGIPLAKEDDSDVAVLSVTVGWLREVHDALEMVAGVRT